MATLNLLETPSPQFSFPNGGEPKVGTNLLQITFAEPVIEFDSTDFASLPSGVGVSNFVRSTTDPKVWTATLSIPDAYAGRSLTLVINGGGYTLESDLSAGSGGSSQPFSIGGEAPVVTPAVTITSNKTDLAAGETALLTFKFTDSASNLPFAVNNFAVEDIDLGLGGGSLSGFTPVSGDQYTAVYTAKQGQQDAGSTITVTAGSYGPANNGLEGRLVMPADTKAPTLSITLNDANLGASETALVTFTFSEAVTGFTNADITLPTGGQLTNVTSADAGKTWTATLSGVTGDGAVAVANNLYTDAIGNNGTGSSASVTFVPIPNAPSVTISLDHNILDGNDTAKVTFTFSEAVKGFSNDSVALTGGTLSSVLAGPGNTYTAVFTPNQDSQTYNGSVAVKAGSYASVANGTVGTAGGPVSITGDTHAPNLLSVTLGDNSLDAGQATPITFTFSEKVVGFDKTDVTVTGGATVSNLTSSADGMTWTGTLTAGATAGSGSISVANGTFTDVIPARTSTTQDPTNAGVGLTNTAPFTIAALNEAPQITSITFSADSGKGVAGDGYLVAGQTSTVTFTFSEAVTGFTADDVDLAQGGTITAPVSADGGKTWTATYTAPSTKINDGVETITVNASDVTDLQNLQGLASSSATANTKLDTHAPTATVTMNNPNLLVTDLPGTAVKENESKVTIAFSGGPVAQSEVSKFVKVSNGTLSGFETTDGGNTYTALFTANAVGSNLTLGLNNGYQDIHGNVGTGASSAQFSVGGVDLVAPENTKAAIADVAPVCVGAPASITEGSYQMNAANRTSTVSFTFSEAVTDFTLSDISHNASAGTVSGLTSLDGINWTATYVAKEGYTGSDTLSVAANSVIDISAQSNKNTKPFQVQANIDTLAPTAVTSVLQGTNQAVFSFSEPVYDITASDFTLPGTISSIVSSADGKSWTVNYNQTGDGNLTLNGQYKDYACNVGDVDSSVKLNTMKTAPTVAISMGQNCFKPCAKSKVSFTFSEAVTGFTLSDVTIGSAGKLSNLTSADGGKTWTADFQAPSFKSSSSATLSVLDGSYTSAASGLAGTGAKTTYGLDMTPPRVTKMCFDDNTLTKGQTTKLHLDFSEKVYGLTASDLCMTGGKIANLTSVDGIKWTADFTANETVKTGCSYTSKLTACSYTDCAGYAGNGAAVSFKAVTATVAKSYDDISAVNTFSVL